MVKKYNKAIILLTSIFIISGCSKSNPTSTIDDLLVHFEETDLSVETQTLTLEEKAFVEKFKKKLKETQKKLGIKPKNRKDAPVESKVVRVESIKIKVLRYADNMMAQEAYEKFIEKEEKQKRRAKEKAIPYSRDTYFLNGPFILEINHWKARLKNGKLDTGWPEKIEIGESSLMRTKEAFESFPI